MITAAAAAAAADDDDDPGACGGDKQMRCQVTSFSNNCD